MREGQTKQPVITQSPSFPTFFILIERWPYERFFSFLTKAFVKSEKMIRFHHQRSLYVIMETWAKFENTDRNISSKTYRF